MIEAIGFPPFSIPVSKLKPTAETRRMLRRRRELPSSLLLTPYSPQKVPFQLHYTGILENWRPHKGRSLKSHFATSSTDRRTIDTMRASSSQHDELVLKKIHEIRGQKVVLDQDLAEL